MRVITIIFWVLQEVLHLYLWAVILAAVFSMLVSFGVLDTRNRIVWTIGDFLYRLTEPALRPIRNVLPNFGRIHISPPVLILVILRQRGVDRYHLVLDISPLVLILVIWVLQMLLARLYAAIMYGNVQGLFF
jgi:YggT family protein